MYSLNEKVVYPGHGVAQIKQVIEKSFGATRAKFYELKFLNKEMTILIPIDSQDSCGIRSLSTEKEINELLTILAEPVLSKKNCATSSWSKRNKQYQYRIKTGDLTEITKIYRDLQCMAHEKDLSFGERSLLSQTESLIAEEISLVKNLIEEQVIQDLRAMFLIDKKITSKELKQSAGKTAQIAHI
jgi:CarD family transcriptional regulator